MTALMRAEDVSLEMDMRLAEKLIHARGLIPASIQHPGEVLGIILTGRELGMAPMMALRSISFVSGKPVMDAAAQLALMRGRGAKHRWLTQSDDMEKASLELSRAGEEPFISTFTIEMAKRMGLTGKPNWQKMPAQMLRARAITSGLRAWMPEAMAGVYDPEELESHQPPALHVEARRTDTLPAPGGVPAARQLSAGHVEVSHGSGPFDGSTRTPDMSSQPGSRTSPTSTTANTTEPPRAIADVLSDISTCAHVSKLDALLAEARAQYKQLPPALQQEVVAACKAAPERVREREALRLEDEAAERALQARADQALHYPDGGPLDNGDNRGGQTGRAEDGYVAPEPGANDEPDDADLNEVQENAAYARSVESGAPAPGTEVF